MLGFKYKVIFPFRFEALAKYASFLFFCLHVFISPWCPKLIHFILRDAFRPNRETVPPLLLKGTVSALAWKASWWHYSLMIFASILSLISIIP